MLSLINFPQNPSAHQYIHLYKLGVNFNWKKCFTQEANHNANIICGAKIPMLQSYHIDLSPEMQMAE
jgi:hypothetical protein